MRDLSKLNQEEKEILEDSNLLDKLNLFLKNIAENNKECIQHTFKSNEGIKELNETLREIFILHEFNKIPNIDCLYEALNTYSNELCNVKAPHYDGYKIHMASLATIVTAQVLEMGEPLKILPLIEKSNFNEWDLMNITSGVLSRSDLRGTSVLDIIKEKAKDIHHDPDVFTLYSYLAEKYKGNKVKKTELELILKEVNPHIRLEDFLNIKEKLNLKRFGYGIATQDFVEQLIDKAKLNKVEDFKEELSHELSNTTSSSKKMKI